MKSLKQPKTHIFLVSYMVSYHFHEVSVSYQYQDFQTPEVSVSYQYRYNWTCIVSVQYRYRNFSARWYQYRIGIEKSGIEGLCVHFMPVFLFYRAWIAPDLAFYLYFLQQRRKEESCLQPLLSNDLSHKIHPASFFEACSETILLHC